MKDKKINIKVGNDKLTTEDISKHKDFSSLYKKYTAMKTSWYKSPTKLGGISTTVVVTVTVTVTLIHHHKNAAVIPVHNKPATTLTTTTVKRQSSAMQAKTIKYVNPPIKNADIPYKSYSVKAEQGAELKYGNSSKISVPKYCFVDQNGNQVKGDVIIKYREFRNPTDIFLSGVPMTYDSAGKQYTFESAGMLDMRGYQNGQPVFIAQDKNIKVEMLSCGKGTDYNTYRLDTVKRTWVYIERTKTTTSPASAADKSKASDSALAPLKHETTLAKNAVANAQQEEKKLENNKPLQPQQANSSLNSFDINADPKEFPELAVYKNMLFEVDKNDKDFKPDYAKTTWEDASLKRVGTGNNYTFTVKNGSESHSFQVHPVFEGQNYDAAVKQYDAKYKEYETALAARKAEEKKEEEEYIAMVKKQEDAEKLQQEIYKKQEEAWTTSNIVTNYLTVNNFGFVNCDHPGILPSGAVLTPRFVDNKNDSLNYMAVYLVEKGKNAIYTYWPGQREFHFNPNKDNFAWCVTLNNKIAIFSIEDFKKIQQHSGRYTFNMNVIDKPIANDQDVKDIFKQFL